MSDLETKTRELGHSKGDLNKWRKEGFIPGVVYGKDLDQSMPIWVGINTFMSAYQTTGKIMEIKLDGKVEMVNAKKLDRDPMGKLIHVNFHKLVRGQKTQVKIPLNSEGEAKGVQDGGILSWSNDKIVVEGVPKDIPESISIDVTALEIGSALHAKDIKLPKGITLVDDEDMDIISIQAPSMAEPEETEASEGEAEGEAAAAPEASAEEGSSEGEESKE